MVPVPGSRAFSSEDESVEDEVSQAKVQFAASRWATGRRVEHSVLQESEHDALQCRSAEYPMHRPGA